MPDNAKKLMPHMANYVLTSPRTENWAAGDKRQNNFVNEALKHMHTPVPVPKNKCLSLDFYPL